MALGAGIGEKDHNIEKLRYHNIIIMTDADVDGSHIRTLLLTFFYRQMPQIIERGYLYVAQPPLYKIKKGKSERYLKDDREFQDYLIDLGVDGVQIKNKEKTIEGKELRKLVEQLISYKQIMDRIAKKEDPRIVEAMMVATQIRKQTLLNAQELESELNKLSAYLQENFPELSEIKPVITDDEEHSAKRVTYKTAYRGSSRTTVIDTNYLVSAEIHELITLEKDFQPLGSGPYQIWHDEERVVAKDLDQVREYVMNQGKKGINIQRYKGLGEMNPQQLWETTMDPATRTLLQVKIEDAVECDQIFTVLMGDQVEPRREFIETNALNVKNLDV